MFSTLNFEVLFKASPNPYVLLDPDLTIVEANEAYLQVTGRRAEDIIGMNMFDAFPGNPDVSDDPNVHRLRASFEQVLAERKPDTLALISYAISQQTSAGEVVEERYWSATHTPIFNDDGEVAFILQHTVDVTHMQELKEELAAAKASRNDGGATPTQAEEGVFRRAKTVQETNWVLEAERRHLRHLFEQAPGFMAVLRGPNHVFELANDAYYQVVGHREIIGKPVREALPEIEGQGFFELLGRVYASGEPYVGREVAVQLQREPGGPLEAVYVDFVYQPVIDSDGSVSGIFVQGHDVTEQKRTKDELRRHQEHLAEQVRERTRELEASEAALRQAQKMEAIGKLTGGVAHDFNNLLQVIEGNLEFLKRDLNAGNEQAQRRLEDARGAVNRGAKLATQLLTFARRQPLEPQVIHPGRLLRSMDDLLRRTLDETIEVETIIDDSVGNTLIDPNQLENVILNLAINARDAMDNVGQLTIELKNARLDAHYARVHTEVTPGRYVCLVISDTGCGMPPEDVERAFEPFFTTKSEDQGTGLGLSTAYGFVKQSGGHIEIYSEVDEGTTVKIYLPHTHEAEEVDSASPSGPVEGGNEIVLVVEDKADVRATVVEMLAELGYHVLEAADGAGALDIIESGTDIDLLFTDVVMPGPVRSTDLVERAQALVPGLKVLFTSGYTEDAVVHQGRLDPGVRLLNKPYRREELAHMVRRALQDHSPPEAARAPAGEHDGMEEACDDGHAASAEQEPLRILMVEDEELVRRLASEAVREFGHHVVAVESAEEALETFDSQGFDVLFTDVSLPGMSGVALARELRSRAPDMHVILASGYGPSVDIGDGEVLADAVAFLKPYTVDDIEDALHTVLSNDRG